MIQLNEPFLTKNEKKYLNECVDTNWVSYSGRFVSLFEEKIASFSKAKYAVATNSGTSAIHIAFKLIDLKPNDVVVCPTLTFIAAINPIRYCYAIPYFVDSNLNSYSIDEDKTIEIIEKLIKNNKKPKAVLVVHLYGFLAKIKKLIKFCSENEIYLIEDATESLGTVDENGKMAGTFGDIGCYSFNGNKLITCGGGGMLVTNDEKLAKKAKHLTTQAKIGSLEFIHDEIGYNYRLTNIQAAVGVAQAEELEKFVNIKRKNANIYTKELSKINGININYKKDEQQNCCWLYSITVDEKEYGLNAKDLIKKLNDNQIGARPFFKPIHTMEMYQDFNKNEYEIAMKLWENGINLPSSVGLKEEEIFKVIEVIRR